MAEITKILTVNQCPECGHDKFHVLETTGQVICKQCSFVIDESIIDFGRDWSFNEDTQESNSRAGSPFDPRVANNLRTSVGNKDDLRRLKGNNRLTMGRIAKKNNWSASAIEANFNNALNHMRVISSFLRIPDSVEKEAARIYREAAVYGLTRCRSNETLVAASLYISCRLNGIPKTIDEFEAATKINKKSLTKFYKLLIRNLNIKLTAYSPFDYVGRFASALNLSPRTQTAAVELIEEANKKEALSGLNPISVAATTLYISCLQNKERRTQKQMAEATGITEVTLRKRVKDFLKKMNMEI